MNTNEKIILEIKSAGKRFSRSSGMLKKDARGAMAVDGVSLSLKKGEVLGIAGESGSGKTTLAKIACGLLKPDSGGIIVDGKNILDYSRKGLAGKIQMIFQDPFSSINPKLSIGTAISEAAGVRGVKRDLQGRAKELLGMVGLPESILKQYPHQLSGGQRQRVAIARSLAAEPEILVADEPVSSLDMSVQAQIMNLFFDLKKKLGLSYIIISHDLNLLAVACDNIMVMKSGKAVEYGPARAIIKNPQNEYTKKLIDAIPRINEKN